MAVSHFFRALQEGGFGPHPWRDLLPIAYCLLPIAYAWLDAYCLWMHTASGCILPLDAYCLGMHTASECIRPPNAFGGPCHGPGPGPMGPPWAGPLCGPPPPPLGPPLRGRGRRMHRPPNAECIQARPNASSQA